MVPHQPGLRLYRHGGSDLVIERFGAEGAVRGDVQRFAHFHAAQLVRRSGRQAVRRAELGVGLLFGVEAAGIHRLDALRKLLQLGVAALLHGGEDGGVLGQQCLGGDAGDAVPHEAADGLIGAGVGDVCGGDRRRPRRDRDRAQAQLVLVVVLQDVGRLSGHGRRAGLESDGGEVGRRIKLQHHTIHPVEGVVGVGHGQHRVLPAANGHAFEVVVVDPGKARGNGDLPGAGDADGEIAVLCVDAGRAGAQVGGYIFGTVGHAVQRIGNDAHVFFLLRMGVPISVLTVFSPF